MKKSIKRAAIVLLLAMLLGVFCSCKAAAPNGMYAPSESEKYRQGIENIIFALPEDYEITMSANILAGKGEKGDSFTIQCRHSDYHYEDLQKNYSELKEQLVGLYGAYEEKLTEEKTVAGEPALEARYTLTVSGNACSYIQYFFYKNTAFYLFTYTAAPGAEDESLLSTVLSTVTFEKEGFAAPEGYKAVENATVDAVSTDRYLLFCPDEWIIDTTMGMICMRVPSSTILSNISFAEIKTGEDFSKFASDYAAKHLPNTDFGQSSALDKYILATTGRMFATLKDFTLVSTVEEEKITADNMVSLKDHFIVKAENNAKIGYSYFDFTATLSASNAHGSGSLFLEYEENDPEKDSLEIYKFRQYYIYHDGYIYFFTYTASLDRFDEQLSDAGKVVKNFEFVTKD